jgi:hypothetical protein
VVLEHCIDCSPSFPRQESKAETEPLERRSPRAEVTDKKGDLGPRAIEVDERDSRLHHELVPEPRRLLVRIDVAADPREQRRVVDDCTFLLIHLQ